MRQLSKDSALASVAFWLLLLLLPLSACGKKPGMVDPPPDVVEDHFPRSYPDAATDPAATVAPPAKTKPAPAPRRSYY